MTCYGKFWYQVQRNSSHGPHRASRHCVMNEQGLLPCPDPSTGRASEGTSHTSSPGGSVWLKSSYGGPVGWGATHPTSSTVTALPQIGKALPQCHHKSMPQSLSCLPCPNLGVASLHLPCSCSEPFGGCWWCSQTTLRCSLHRSGPSSQQKKHE